MKVVFGWILVLVLGHAALAETTDCSVNAYAKCIVAAKGNQAARNKCNDNKAKCNAAAPAKPAASSMIKNCTEILGVCIDDANKLTDRAQMAKEKAACQKVYSECIRPLPSKK